MKKIALALLLLVGTATAALAAGPAPFVTVTPTPTHVGDTFTLSGCGYGANKDISVSVESPSTPEAQAFVTRVGADGCFDASSFYRRVADVAGVWSIYVYPKTGNATGTYGHHKDIVDFDFDVT